MFPSQTSLIPATVALAKFLEANGAGGVYPFWYLGTTPFKYLTGPVVPYLLVLLKEVIPAFSYFDLVFVLIAAGFVIEAVGWGIFAGYLSKNRKLGLAAGILSLIMPWHIVSALGLSEVSAMLAGSLIPWVLLAFQRFTIYDLRFKNLLPSAIVFALLLLTNSTTAVPVIVGLLILSFSTFNSSSFAKASEDKQFSTLKRVLAVVLLGWVLTLWWYSPGYWLTVWGAPGIGGKNILGVLGTLMNFLRGFLPVIAAVLIVFWKVKPKTVFDKFSLGWIVIFGSLTLFRFMADWDFWMDWTAWMGEVEVGVALLIAGPVSRFLPADAPQPFSSKVDNPNLGNNFKKGWVRVVGNPSTTATRNTWLVLVIGIYLFFGWFLAWQNRGFWLPRTNISQTVEYKIAKWLELNTGPVSRFPPASARSDQGLNINGQDNPDLRAVGNPSTTATRFLDGPTVFLSGTTAFWLNSLADVRQVRGGRDEGSVDSRWREAVWEVREGEYGRDSVDILKRLGVDYLVVHTDESTEYYHDFKYPQKFEGRKDLEKVYDDHGDTIYKVSGT